MVDAVFPEERAPTKIGFRGLWANRRWAILAFVLTASILNYADRQTLALLKPMLEVRFEWSNQDYANMLSAFQLATAFAFLGAGWFVDRVGLRLGYAIGVAAWSLAGIAHAFAGSVGAFMVARTALGVAESVGAPATVKSAATYFSREERSLALGITGTAPNIGAILAPLAIPALAIAYGWQAPFLVFGGLGFVWLFAWLKVRVPPVAAEGVKPAAISWLSLLRRRATWAVTIGKVLSDQVWFFMLAWLPDLFHRTFGLGQSALGYPIALVYSMAALGAVCGGLFTTFLFARGWSLNRARKSALLFFALLVLPVAIVAKVNDPWLAALLLGLGLFAHQGFSVNMFALATDVAPARAVGSTIGIAAFCGNAWSIMLIQFAAFALARGWGYGLLLSICSVSYLLALAIVHLLLPKITAAQ